jgi:hypothetical protein
VLYYEHYYAVALRTELSNHQGTVMLLLMLLMLMLLLLHRLHGRVCGCLTSGSGQCLGGRD